MSAAIAIPAAWTATIWHPEYERLFRSPARHRVVAAGRQSGKTKHAKECVVDGDEHHNGALRTLNGRFAVCGPTHSQVRGVWWDDLKAMSKPWLASAPNETDMILRFITGSTIQLFSLDKPQRVEGRAFNGAVMDEAQECASESWTNSLRPTLSGPGREDGWSIRSGRPRGRQHFFDWWTEARNKRGPKGEALDDHDAFHWKSSVVQSDASIQAARRSLDELSFRREYEASWDEASGLAYYAWDRTKNCRPLNYDQSAPVILMFDFNRNPGVVVVAQEQAEASRACDCGYPTPSGQRCRACGVFVPFETATCVIGEVRVMNSNTPSVCAELVRQWKGASTVTKACWQGHQGEFHVYGDATGGVPTSSQTDGTSWALVRKCLDQHLPRITWLVGRSNPQEIERVANTNFRISNAAGDVRLFADETKAPFFVKDMEGVMVKEGSSGELDKNKTPLLSHLSDAMGYYLWEAFRLQHGRALQVF